MSGIETGGSVMMGRQTNNQRHLFYLFNLEERIPERHLLRRINPIIARAVDQLRATLAASTAR